jgi:hypothetical protein
MTREHALTRTNEGTIYAGLLVVQTAAATFMFWVVFPLFRQMIDRLGEPQELDLSVEVMILFGTLVLQCAYWARYRWITVWVPFRSAVIGHVIQFASRISFFFGGALFSMLFFRHLPELEAFPAIEQAANRGLVIMWVLFALFCYSLELDRLGRAMEKTEV